MGKPIKWAFKLRRNMPILEVRGTCDGNVEKSILLNSALGFIELAMQFYADLLGEEPTYESNSDFSVYFSLIFKTESDLERFFGPM